MLVYHIPPTLFTGSWVIGFITIEIVVLFVMMLMLVQVVMLVLVQVMM